MPLPSALLALAVLSSGSASPWPDLSHTPPSGALGGRSDAAVLVAVEDYARLEDIPGAKQRVDDWTRWLARTRGVPVTRIHRLVDQRVSPERMLAAMEAAANQVGEDGTLWFVFVGHVVPGPGGLDHAFVAADAAPSVEGVHTASVTREALSVRSRQARSVWVVDASLKGKGEGGAPLVAGLPEPRPALPTLPNQLMFAWADGRVGSGELPGLPGPALSYLTLGAVRGWADQNGDGDVHSSELLDFVAGAVWSSGLAHDVAFAGTPARVVSGATESGPDLVEHMVDPLQPANLDGVAVVMTRAPDLAEQARWAADAEATEAAIASEVDGARRRAVRDRSARLSKAAEAVKRQARSDWAALKPALDSGGERSYTVVQGFVDTYSSARVTADDVSRWVLVPEVELARDWLRQRDQIRARDPLSPPAFLPTVSPTEREAAMADFRSCVSLANPDACADLGVRYAQGTDGVVVDPDKSVAMYRRGCAQESGLACNNLGVAYGRGAGVQADPVQARRWLETACSLDAGRGCGNLAVLLSVGEGGTRDVSRALQVLTRGCGLDDAVSCHRLATALVDGTLGGEADPMRAQSLWSKACTLGHTESCALLEDK